MVYIGKFVCWENFILIFHSQLLFLTLLIVRYFFVDFISTGWWEAARGSSVSIGGGGGGSFRFSFRSNSNSARESFATAASSNNGLLVVEMSSQRPSGSVSVVNPLQRSNTYNSQYSGSSGFSSAAPSRTTSTATAGGVLQAIKR